MYAAERDRGRKGRMSMKPQRINIESEALEEFRQSLNAALEIVTCQLMRKRLHEGTVSAKVKISLEERQDDKTGEIYYTMELEPKVTMKIGASDNMGCGKKAGIIMQPDRDGRPMIASQQITMDELEKEGA